MSLEIGTSVQPERTNHWIAGPLKDLSTLASSIESVADTSPVGERVSLRRLFATESPYDLIVAVKDDAFDPAREDPQCW
jgi:hypothetical protein